MKIEIQALSDEYDCETCGGSWEEGFVAIVDGQIVFDGSPSAHCFGGKRSTIDQALSAVLEHLGHEVVFTNPA